MTSNPLEIGALLPHFGSAARRDLLADVAKAAAGNDLSSLWVRDHLLYGPHGMEDPDPTFLETFTTLGYAAAIAPGLDLGTAAVIPVRHPLMLGKAAATAAALTTGRLKLGIGAGFRDNEFSAIGLDTDLKQRARDVVPTTFEILRALREGRELEHRGPHWTFDAVTQWPALPDTTRFLYCGTSPLALRLASRYADGWAPGRITGPTLRRRLQERTDTTDDFDVVVIPLVVLADHKQEAVRRLDLDPLLEYANGHRWLDRPEHGAFGTADDLEGIVLHGNVDDIADGVERLHQAGATEIVLDLRLGWDGAADVIAALGRRLASIAGGSRSERTQP